MRLTKSTSHAIRILIECARADGRLVKVAELSERLHITQQNVFKIVNLLVRSGFIVSMRGRHGGVKLSRPAAVIRIGDVVRATEVTRVEIEGATGAARDRGVNRVLDDALEAFVEVLDQYTIADMLKNGTSPTALAGKPTRRAKKPSARAVSLRSSARTRRTSHTQ
jgi:Rrf2 family nitric oxide-sensitive transcriptional repressor